MRVAVAERNREMANRRKFRSCRTAKRLFVGDKG
jgi:hypothetical protein